MKNRQITIFAGVVLLLIACSSATPIKIVTFGDSTTALRSTIDKVYSDRLPALLKADGIDVTIINAGVGGNTTEHAIARLESDVLAHKADLVVVQFGINDAIADTRIGQTEPRVAIDKYRSNLNQIILRIKESGSRIVLMTPNPLRWTSALIEDFGTAPYDTDDPRGFNLFLDEYVPVVREIAERSKIPLVDINRVFEEYDKVDGQQVDDLLLDGIHPNDDGHAIVAQQLSSTISPIIQSLSASIELSSPAVVNACESRRWSTLFTNSVDIAWNWPEDATDAELEIAGMNTQSSMSFNTTTSNYLWQVFSGDNPSTEDVYELSLLFKESGGAVISSCTSRLAVVKGAFGATLVNAVTASSAWKQAKGNPVIPYDASWDMNAYTNSINADIEISRRGGMTENTQMSTNAGYFGWKLTNSEWGYGIFDLELTFPGSTYVLQAELERWPQGTILQIL